MVEIQPMVNLGMVDPISSLTLIHGDQLDDLKT